MDEIFISYRRRDTSLFVQVIADQLRRRFNVFVDFDDIALGDTFMSTIQRAIGSAKIVVLVIGAQWDVARLHDAADVVAYELRLAKRFERRVIPVIIEPAALPSVGSLPSDLRWIGELNAFMIPEPPQHRAQMAQLVDLVGRAMATSLAETPARIFSVPLDVKILQLGRGNVPFTEIPVNEDIETCAINGSQQVVWLASYKAIEVRDVMNGSRRHSLQPGAEWLYPISTGALAARSTIGYQSPDTIHFSAFEFNGTTIRTVEAGFTWSWQLPPFAVSPDESTIAAYVTTPSRRDVLFFSVKDRKETAAWSIRDSHVVSMCYDPGGTHLFVLAIKRSDGRLVSIDVGSRSILWSRDIQVEPETRSDRRSHEVAFWSVPSILLVNTGNRVVEVNPSTGEFLRIILTADDGLRCLATDRSTSLAFVADKKSLIMWLPGADSFVSVEHHGDLCCASSLHGGSVAALIVAGDKRKLLTASGVRWA